VTTPNQPKPDYGNQWLDLSYEIGGGAYNYGQEIDSDLIKWLIYGPKATLENVWELIEFHLLKQPLEVLQTWQPFIAGTSLIDDFFNVEQSVKTIVEYIPTIPKLLRVDEWLAWIESVFEPLVKEVENLLAWIVEIFDPWYELVNEFIADALEWLEVVFKPIEELIPVIEAVANDALELGTEILEALMRGFHGWGKEVTGFVADDLRQVGASIGTAIGELNHVALRVVKLEGEVFATLENFATYTQDALGLGTELWDQIYEGTGGGTLGTQLGYAVFDAAEDTVDKLAHAISKEKLLDDFQTVSTVISKPLNDAAQSANTILARVEDTAGVLGDHVFATMTDTVATVGFVTGGVKTVLGTVDNLLKNGSTYTLEAGVGDAANTFRLVENSKELLKVTDPLAGLAGGSSLGPNNLLSGFSVLAPNPTARPGVVAAFAARSRKR
jgi:hypothetical protein